MDTLSRLEATIRQRLATGDPQASYVAGLGARGTPAIARKLGEEAVETIVAALDGSRDDLTGEAADLLFHLLVLLAKEGVALSDVAAELDRREGVSGLAEKAARSS
jgi:phosphoribosyl-ATP pyrophosphohydrolase